MLWCITGGHPPLLSVWLGTQLVWHGLSLICCGTPCVPIHNIESSWLNRGQTALWTRRPLLYFLQYLGLWRRNIVWVFFIGYRACCWLPRLVTTIAFSLGPYVMGHTLLGQTSRGRLLWI